MLASRTQLLRYLDNLPWQGLFDEAALLENPNTPLPAPVCSLSDFAVTCELIVGEEERIAQSWTGTLARPVDESHETTFRVPIKWAEWQRSWDDAEAPSMRLRVCLSRCAGTNAGIQTVLCFVSDVG